MVQIVQTAVSYLLENRISKSLVFGNMAKSLPFRAHSIHVMYVDLYYDTPVRYVLRTSIDLVQLTVGQYSTDISQHRQGAKDNSRSLRGMSYFFVPLTIRGELHLAAEGCAC